MTRAEAERAVLEHLATLQPREYVHRLDIGAAVFAKTGGTLLASIVGDLLNRKLITRPIPDPGSRCHRYGITDAGRAALDLVREMEAA